MNPAGAHREWRPLSAACRARLCRHGCRYPPLAPSSPQAQTVIPGRTAWPKPEPDAWTGQPLAAPGRPREMPGDTATRGHRRPVSAPGYSAPASAAPVSPVQPAGCRAARYGLSLRNSPRRFQSVSAPGWRNAVYVPHFAVPPQSSNAPRTAPADAAPAADHRHVAGCAADGPAGENPCFPRPITSPRR